MSEIAIRVEGLGKEYQVAAGPERYKTLRDKLAEGVRWPARALLSMFGRGESGPSHAATAFWALSGISFSIAKGEIVGVIGRNGAGKSTLLKVLSRITEPTTGRVEIHGRVGSLLEVGTGFHPELSGRENIFLNGAILGMRRAEIAKSFDAIVAFAEVDRFIDTPVKRYSSGMYLRLAFAVAAHLETEILLVDEVLAVGDVGFQKKCIGRIGEVARAGRTVLFVSHNMAAIESLCGRCLLIDRGQLAGDGGATDIIRQYMSGAAGDSPQTSRLVNRPRSTRDLVAVMTSVSLLDAGGQPTSEILMNGALAIRITFTARHPLNPVFGLVIKTAMGVPVLGVNNRFVPSVPAERPFTSGFVEAKFKVLPLVPGTYFVDLYLGDEYVDHDVVLEATSFEVHPADVFGTGRLPPPGTGAVVLPAEYTIAPDATVGAGHHTRQPPAELLHQKP